MKSQERFSSPNYSCSVCTTWRELPSTLSNGIRTARSSSASCRACRPTPRYAVRSNVRSNVALKVVILSDISPARTDRLPCWVRPPQPGALPDHPGGRGSLQVRGQHGGSALLHCGGGRHCHRLSSAPGAPSDRTQVFLLCRGEHLGQLLHLPLPARPYHLLVRQRGQHRPQQPHRPQPPQQQHS